MMCFVTKKKKIKELLGRRGSGLEQVHGKGKIGRRTRTIRHNPQPPCFILSSTACCAAHLHVIYLPFLHSTRLLNCPQGNFHVSLPFTAPQPSLPSQGLCCFPPKPGLPQHKPRQSHHSPPYWQVSWPPKVKFQFGRGAAPLPLNSLSTPAA